MATRKCTTRAARRRLLRAALAAYGLSPGGLRRWAAQEPERLHELLQQDAPPELRSLLGALVALLTPPPRTPITDAAELAGALMARLGHCDQEHLAVACLDTRHQLQQITLVYRGTLNHAAVRPAEVFKPAIRLNSAAVILVHNHPSGIVTPSPDDLRFTRLCRRAGALLDITLLDHLIIGAGRWARVKG